MPRYIMSFHFMKTGSDDTQDQLGCQSQDNMSIN
uniref:Uncharacterized protein n=1 Tax=Manihot esculenta TaxID=3983 RepID=A0A2C9VW60_MANES